MKIKKIFSLVLALVLTALPCGNTVFADDGGRIAAVPLTDFSSAPSLVADGGTFISGSSSFSGGVLTVDSVGKSYPSGCGFMLGGLDEAYRTANYAPEDDVMKDVFSRYTHVFTARFTVNQLDTDSARMTFNGAVSSGAAKANLSNVRSTLVCASRGSEDGTWRLSLNTTGDADGKMAKLDSYLTPDGCDNLAFGESVSLAVVMHSEGEKDYMHFFVNGVYYGTADAYETGDYRLYRMTGIRFRAATGAKATFENVSYMAYDTSAAAWNIRNIEKTENSEYRVTFADAVTDGVREHILIDGSPADAANIRICDDQFGVVISGIQKLNFTLSLDDSAVNAAGICSNGESYDFVSVKFAERTVLMPKQTFDDGFDKSLWSYCQFTQNDGYISAVQSANSMSKLLLHYPDELLGAIADSKPYKLVISGKMNILSADDDTSFGEIGLSYSSVAGSSEGATRKRLFSICGKGATVKIGSKESLAANSPRTGTPIFDAGTGRWVSVTIVIDVGSNGSGTVSYYVDGAAYKNIAVTGPNAANEIRLGAQNYISVGIDDFEAYAYIDGVSPFEIESFTDSAEPTDSVEIKFSSPVFSGDFDGMISVGGEVVGAERISQTDSCTLAVAPPDGGFESQKDYTVSISADCRDVFGTYLSGGGEFGFRTGGDALTVRTGGVILGADGASCTVRIRNVSGEQKALYVLMGEYGETGGDRIIENMVCVPVTVPSRDEWVDVPLGMSAADSANDFDVCVWAQGSLAPVGK